MDGREDFWINFEFVEFFGGWLEDFVGEREDLVLRRGFCCGGGNWGICWGFCWVVLGFGMYLLGCIGYVFGFRIG